MLAAAVTGVSAFPQQSGNNFPQQGEGQGQSTPPPKQGGVIRVPVNEVSLSVTVKTKQGQIVADLHKDEFRIFEDDIEQTVGTFTSEAYPLSVLILIDNDMKDKDAQQVQESIKGVIAGLSANDEAAICRFDEFFHEGKGFTSDQDKLLTELKRTRLDSEPQAGQTSASMISGPTINGHSATSDAPNIAPTTAIIKGQSIKALDDAVFAAAGLLGTRGDRRKLILLISDGVNGTKFNKNNFDVTLKQLLRNNVSVYSVAVNSAYLNRKFNHMVDYPKHTGGDVYFPLKRGSMEELYARVTEEARHQYILTYAPRGTDHNAPYHTVEVRVKREGLNILTRDGYFSGAIPR